MGFADGPRKTGISEGTTSSAQAFAGSGIGNDNHSVDSLGVRRRSDDPFQHRFA